MSKGPSGGYVDICGSSNMQHKVTGIRKRWGWFSTLWEGNNPAQRSCGNGVLLGVAQVQHLSQGPPDRGITRQKIGTRSQDLAG